MDCHFYIYVFLGVVVLKLFAFMISFFHFVVCLLHVGFFFTFFWCVKGIEFYNSELVA